MIEGLAGMPPGAGLAAALAAVDRAGLDGHDQVTVLASRWRLLAWVHSEVFADMAHLVASPPDGFLAENPDQLFDLAAAEIRACLHLTRRSAEAWLASAMTLVQDLPAVHAALSAGEIDLARARVIADGLTGLPDETARTVAEQILTVAPRLTTGQLRERLRRMVIAVDPAAAEARQQQAVEDRRVHAELTPAGTAVLAGHDLPTDRAVAAYAYVDAIAKGLKRSGDPRSLDQLRADTFLDLLEGCGLPGAATSRPDDAGARRPDDAGARRPDDAGARRPDCAEAARTDGVGAGQSGGVESAPEEPSPARPHGGAAPQPTRGGQVEVIVPLATLLRLAEYPGEIPGWGPVIAQTARTIAERQAQTSPWRMTVYDADGHLVHTGPIRRHPTKADADQVKARDRRCTFPGCRTPARNCDLDHLRDWAMGGPTTPANLAAKCRSDHRLKRLGWRSRQVAPGVWAWLSPHRRLYLNQTEPIGPPHPTERRRQ